MTIIGLLIPLAVATLLYRLLRTDDTRWGWVLVCLACVVLFIIPFARLAVGR